MIFIEMYVNSYLFDYCIYVVFKEFFYFYKKIYFENIYDMCFVFNDLCMIIIFCKW